MPKPVQRFRRPIIMAALCLSAFVLFAQEEATSSAWYASGLEKLGFTVFPKPQPLEEYVVQALGGARSKLSDQKGKIVLLNFWATWCPPCRAEMPSIDALWKKTKDVNFTVMGVSVGEDPAKVKDFIAGQGYPTRSSWIRAESSGPPSARGRFPRPTYSTRRARRSPAKSAGLHTTARRRSPCSRSSPRDKRVPWASRSLS